MSREVRRVPASWEHPKGEDGRYKPLFGDSFAIRAAEWDRNKAEWDEGKRPDYIGDFAGTFEEWEGTRPEESEFMPDWPDSERTHLQMYQTTSEGTPISPVMARPEDLARWLVDNNASAFAGQTASYEAWLRVCLGGHAPSMAVTRDGVVSGVEALTNG